MIGSTKEERFNRFVQGLDFRKRAALALLDETARIKLRSLPEDCWETGLLVFDLSNRRANGRECWVNGIEHMQQFVANPDHFIDLIRQADLHALDDMITLILDTKAGKLDYLQQHDKRLMNLLHEGTKIFFGYKLDTVDYPGLVSTFQEIEERK